MIAILLLAAAVTAPAGATIPADARHVRDVTFRLCLPYRTGEADCHFTYSAEQNRVFKECAYFVRTCEEVTPGQPPRREKFCEGRGDEPVGLLGATRRTQGWCP